MDILVVKKEATVDKTQVDIIRVIENKHRTTPEKLREKKAYLEANIAKWQADLAETNALIDQVYEAINTKI